MTRSFMSAMAPSNELIWIMPSWIITIRLVARLAIMPRNDCAQHLVNFAGGFILSHDSLYTDDYSCHSQTH
jgi:hypothetical protein